MIPSENRRVPSEYNEQEKAVLEYLQEKGSIKSKQVETLLNIKESRTRELLRQLLDNGVIERKGQGRSTYYTLAK